jgi:predicted nucleic acid-binding protein
MTLDRVFLDANVLFSAAYGSPGLRRLWALAEKGHCRLLTSAQAVEEARRNLDRPAQERRLDRYVRQLEVVPIPEPQACPLDLPPEDALIFLAAVEARATHLLTGDLRHFGPYLGRCVSGVRLLRPGEYVRATDLDDAPPASAS